MCDESLHELPLRKVGRSTALRAFDASAPEGGRYKKENSSISSASQHVDWPPQPADTVGDIGVRLVYHVQREPSIMHYFHIIFSMENHGNQGALTISEVPRIIRVSESSGA